MPSAATPAAGPAARRRRTPARARRWPSSRSAVPAPICRPRAASPISSCSRSSASSSCSSPGRAGPSWRRLRGAKARSSPRVRSRWCRTWRAASSLSFLVREGAIVERGEVLVRIDDVRAASELRESRQRHLALARGALSRLRAEVDETTVAFAPEITGRGARRRAERACPVRRPPGCPAVGAGGPEAARRRSASRNWANSRPGLASWSARTRWRSKSWRSPSLSPPVGWCPRSSSCACSAR